MATQSLRQNNLNNALREIGLLFEVLYMQLDLRYRSVDEGSGVAGRDLT